MTPPPGYDLGCDLVAVAEVRDALDRFGDHYLRRVYTRAEAELCAGRADRLAARFAAKEAVMKLFRDPSLALPFTDIEVVSGGALPSLALRGLVARASRWDLLQLSLSHTDTHAMAVVLGRRALSGSGARS